jgi:hypothetical protein
MGPAEMTVTLAQAVWNLFVRGALRSFDRISRARGEVVASARVTEADVKRLTITPAGNELPTLCSSTHRSKSSCV